MASTLSQEFDTIAAEIKASPVATSNKIKLKLYGLFKQATAGDCTKSAPMFVTSETDAKVDAWAKEKGTSKEDAKASYIEEAKRVLGKGE